MIIEILVEFKVVQGIHVMWGFMSCDMSGLSLE